MTKQTFLQKAERITKQIRQRISDEEESKTNFLEISNTKEIITYDDAEKRYSIENFSNHEYLVLVIHGDVYIKGDFTRAWILKQVKGMQWNGDYYGGVVINGNLVVEGSVLDDDSFSGPLELSVTQNLTCDYLFSYDGEIFIVGDANVKYGIYGQYNNGYLHIRGKVYTPYLLALDHDMPRKAEGDYIYIEGGTESEKENIMVGMKQQDTNPIGWGWDYFEDSGELFVPEVWNNSEYEDFSVEQFFSIIRKGENPFISSSNI